MNQHRQRPNRALEKWEHARLVKLMEKKVRNAKAAVRSGEVRRKSTTSSKPLAQRARRSSGGDADPRCVLVDEEGGDRQIEYKSRSSSLADEESPVLRQLQNYAQKATGEYTTDCSAKKEATKVRMEAAAEPGFQIGVEAAEVVKRLEQEEDIDTDYGALDLKTIESRGSSDNVLDDGIPVDSKFPQAFEADTEFLTIPMEEDSQCTVLMGTVSPRFAARVTAMINADNRDCLPVLTEDCYERESIRAVSDGMATGCSGNSSRWSEAEDMPIESELDIPTNINYEEYEDDFEDDCDDPEDGPIETLATPFVEHADEQRTDHRDSIIVRENSAPPVGVLHSGVAHLAKSYLEVIPGVYARMSTLKLHANE